jgi:hypothetical protein
LTFRTFIALLLMSGSAAISAHAHAVKWLHGVAQCSSMTSFDSLATSAHAGWQQATCDDDSNDGWLLVDDHDVDDELLQPSPVPVWLDYFPSVAPLSAGASPYPTPVTSPLRPPSLI